MSRFEEEKSPKWAVARGNCQKRGVYLSGDKNTFVSAL